MATRYHKFSGKCKWPKLDKLSQYGKYEINLYLDPKSKKKYVEAGCQGQIREDEEGQFVVLRREPERLFGGEVKKFGKPQCLDLEGKEVDPRILGNGSEVVCEVACYDTKKGIGTRLEKVIVSKLIEYQGAAA
jgi:hypothetical protein